MNRTVCILLGSFGLALVTGCASGEHIQRKLGLLENEIADLHQANRKINQRIDELQIQLSVISNKLAARGDDPLQEASARPVLKVVKLRPGKTTKKKQTRLKFPNKRGSMLEIDPRKVSERLPVDDQAARRNLWGLEANQ